MNGIRRLGNSILGTTCGGRSLDHGDDAVNLSELLIVRIGRLCNYQPLRSPGAARRKTYLGPPGQPTHINFGN